VTTEAPLLRDIPECHFWPLPLLEIGLISLQFGHWALRVTRSGCRQLATSAGNEFRRLAQGQETFRLNDAELVTSSRAKHSANSEPNVTSHCFFLLCPGRLPSKPPVRTFRRPCLLGLVKPCHFSLFFPVLPPERIPHRKAGNPQGPISLHLSPCIPAYTRPRIGSRDGELDGPECQMDASPGASYLRRKATPRRNAASSQPAPTPWMEVHRGGAAGWHGALREVT
jgi:hypothetical protein